MMSTAMPIPTNAEPKEKASLEDQIDAGEKNQARSGTVDGPARLFDRLEPLQAGAAFTSLGPISIWATLVPIHMLAPMMWSHKATLRKVLLLLGRAEANSAGEPLDCGYLSLAQSSPSFSIVSGTMGSRTAWTWLTPAASI